MRPYKSAIENLHRETLRALNRPGRARTVPAAAEVQLREPRRRTERRDVPQAQAATRAQGGECGGGGEARRGERGERAVGREVELRLAAGRVLSLSAYIHMSVLDNSCDRMCL
jgi:hypothetical protein